MKKNDSQFIADWSNTRKKGLFRFMLSSGLVFSVIMILFNIIWESFETSFGEVISDKMTLIRALIWIGAGLLVYAPLFWFISESRYRKLTGESTSGK
ncbi:MAG: hypothetical protein R2850_03355 [Bacteroidia bacterium]